MADKLVEIEVIAATDRVLLWERDERHPEGEVLITNKGKYTVALTDGVRQLVSNGEAKLLGELTKNQPDAGPNESAPVNTGASSDEGKESLEKLDEKRNRAKTQ